MAGYVSLPKDDFSYKISISLIRRNDIHHIKGHLYTLRPTTYPKVYSPIKHKLITDQCMLMKNFVLQSKVSGCSVPLPNTQ